jgi:hypothetical protein
MNSYVTDSTTDRLEIRIKAVSKKENIKSRLRKTDTNLQM